MQLVVGLLQVSPQCNNSTILNNSLKTHSVHQYEKCSVKNATDSNCVN